MRKLRILVVDDQVRARRSVQALLAIRHLVGEIQEASNGREAVDRLQEFQPDIVLMDVRMPEMDGLEATRRIKARWKAVQVILLSMYPEYEQEAQAAGADAFFCKADSPDRLLERLTNMAHEAM